MQCKINYFPPALLCCARTPVSVVIRRAAPIPTAWRSPLLATLDTLEQLVVQLGQLELVVQLVVQLVELVMEAHTDKVSTNIILLSS